MSQTTITTPRQRAKKTFPERVRRFEATDTAETAALLAEEGWEKNLESWYVTDRLVAVEDGRIVGHAAVSRITISCPGCDECVGRPRPRRGGRAHIEAMVVHRDHRGCGLAKDLLRAAKLLARHEGLPWLQLDVRTDNDIAMRLYTSMGFRPVDDVTGLVPGGCVRLRRRS